VRLLTCFFKIERKKKTYRKKENKTEREREGEFSWRLKWRERRGVGERDKV
jgi:hypothetical protein